LTGSDAGQGTEISTGLPIRRIAAVVLGNALEFYDFLTYSFFAVQIGNTFFPQHAGASTLLLSELVFFAGFLPRPFGGLVIGMLGDRWGRKPAMILTFTLMGVAIVGFALTPSYRAIGMAAPVLILCFRLIQGFALGGEVGPTTAYLLESAAPKNRGFYTSIQTGTQDLAVLVAGLIGFVLANVLDANALQDWGWRVAFLLGACVVPFGLAVRRNLPETIRAADIAKSKLRDMRFHLRPAIIGFILLSSMSITYYVIAYLTTYATATLHMPSNVAFGATIVAGICGVVFDVTSGALSDRIGRKPIMLVTGPLLIAIVLPAFYVIAHFRSTAVLLGTTAVFCILQSFYAPPILISLTESLPRPIRSVGLAIVYALAVSIVGGATQPVVTKLIEVTGNPLAPAWLLLCTLTIGFVAVLFVRETAPVKTGIVTP
jgi:MFS transporter, MHS family, citrate/tricarballylate:H+ symporter